MQTVERTGSEPAAPDLEGRLSEWPSKATSVGNWVEDRTGIVSAGASIRRWQVPSYATRSILYALGGLTLIGLVFQVFTGILMTFYYDPSTSDAYNSVDYITYQLPLGWLVRGIHHYNASVIVILVFLHLLRTLFYSAYKRPREVTWISGVLLLLITLGFGFTGYLLPWDQRGYWATVVSSEIAAKAPVIGEFTSRMMKGGALVGQLTLTRFFVIHVAILPMALLLLLLIHFHQIRRHNIAPGIKQRAPGAAPATVNFVPNWTSTVALLGFGLLALLVFLSWRERAPLTFPADPASSNFNPRPEWYFLFLYELLRFAPASMEPLLIVGIPTLVIGSLLLLPFLDRGNERRPWRKPIVTSIALFYIAVIVVFTLLAL